MRVVGGVVGGGLEFCLGSTTDCPRRQLLLLFPRSPVAQILLHTYINLAVRPKLFEAVRDASVRSGRNARRFRGHQERAKLVCLSGGEETLTGVAGRGFGEEPLLMLTDVEVTACRACPMTSG